MKKNTIFILILLYFIFILIFLISALLESNSDISLGIYIILYFALILIYIIVERKNIISIKTVYILMYSLMLGLSPLFFYLNNKTLVFNGKSLSYQFSICILGLLFLLVGIIVEKNINNKNLIREKFYNHNYCYDYNFSIILILLSTLANVIYIVQNKSLLFGGNLEANRITSMSGSGLILTIAGLNILGTCMLFNYYCVTKKHKTLTFFSIILSTIFYIIRGSRTPILRIFIICIMIYNLHHKISLKKASRLFLIALIILSGLQVVRTMQSGGELSFFKAFYSNLQVGSINLNYVFNTFPKKINYQLGYTYLINILMLKPGPDLDFTLWLKEKIGINFDGGGLTPTIFGEGYINFSYIGGFAEIFIIGFMAQLFDKKYNINNKNAFWSIYFSIILMDAFRGGFANNEIIIIISMILFFAYQVMYIRNKEN